MKAEMNSRSMLQFQFGMRHLSSAGTPSTNETATPATTPTNIGQSEKVTSLRPLSPHLPIYKPQSSSMLSITHRITSVYLVGVVLAYSVIFLQMGKICLTSFPFYQFCCYVAKLTPITMELAALALAYNIFHSLTKIGGRI
nr:succinate dehydrogenase 3 [Sedum plumbizincicola]